jgi:hypothetical protein
MQADINRPHLLSSLAGSDSKNYYSYMRMWIAVSMYPLYIYYLIHSPKPGRFELSIGYIYINLIGCVAFSDNI